MAKINQASWGPLNEHIYSCSDDNTVAMWDAHTGQQVKLITDHRNMVTSINFSKDRNQFITSSYDLSAKLYDTRTCQLLKTYETEMPVNCAAISPLMDHILLGGGQEASKVTTDGAQGRFEVRFFHKIYEVELALLKGHFSPVNSLAFSPDGRSFVTGAEEGLVRLQHFDPSYFSSTELI
eukprot:gnl/Spiro4/26096_TR13018_c0_g3_i1.p2 gnl/Spiro4/26096_TR13018_c0_g3~~gnl/Spiro4/26096_TR13018_c0_g3_i1.p2  ORF type:complete len:180 (-),score=43.67 gnl/Spiro4/26096_TR13018_c0_g3_i1:46-585(-)